MDREQGPLASEVPDRLVMAMPRRETYGVSGFVTDMRWPLLESVAEEAWYATPDAIADDVDAKQVRIGVLLCCGADLLVDEDGTLLHLGEVPSEASQLGRGLRGLRRLARVAAGLLLATGEETNELPLPELVGYLCDDRDPELRPFLTLVYRAVAPPGTPAPPGATWIPPRHLGVLPLQPASAMVAEVLARTA